MIESSRENRGECGQLVAMFIDQIYKRRAQIDRLRGKSDSPPSMEHAETLSAQRQVR